MGLLLLFSLQLLLLLPPRFSLQLQHPLALSDGVLSPTELLLPPFCDAPPPPSTMQLPWLCAFVLEWRPRPCSRVVASPEEFPKKAPAGNDFHSHERTRSLAAESQHRRGH